VSGDRVPAPARLGAAAFIVLCAGIFLRALWDAPAYLGLHPQVVLPETWTVEQTRSALAQTGLSLDTWIGMNLASYVFVALVFCAVGALILVRRSDEWFGLFVGTSFWLFGTQASDVQFIAGELYPGWRWLTNLLANLSWYVFFILFSLFPDGVFVPRWTRWTVLGWAALLAWTTLDPGAATEQNNLLVLLSLLLLVIAVASQVYRYRFHSDAVQRQQTKWVLMALVVVALMIVFLYFPTTVPGLVPETSAAGQWFTLFGNPLGFILISVVPLSVAIAIFRYRLWDIDILIRRTLTYALVTSALLAVFFGSVVVLQQFFVSLTGARQNELVTVLSTLAIAALFVPLRNAVQRAIDRRFNRRKYDAQQVLARFAQTVRDETDIEDLTGRLVEVVDETMQPRTVSLWLKKEGGRSSGA
jgi:hypothetical protein